MPTNIEKLIAVGDIFYTVDHNGKTVGISISNAHSLDMNGTEALSLIVSANRDGVQLEVDNPFLYINPDVMAFDGTYTLIDGINIKNQIENPEEALKTMVFNTAKVVVL